MKYLFIHRNWLGLVAAVLIISSCQKVIEVPINEEDDIYIIEAVMKDRANESFIKASKSVNIYSSMTQELISGASFTVTDDNMQSWVFTEDPGEPGTYLNNSFIVQENTTYTIDAVIEGHAVTGTSYSKKDPIMDSIYARPNELDIEAPYSQWIFYHSTDRVDEQNNYRLKIWINGEQPDQYYIGNDYYINGETYEAQFFLADAYQGDTVKVEMLEMDEHVYTYFYGLQNTLTTGAFSPAPANPPSNLKCETAPVNGYFGVFMTQIDSMIVP